MVLVSLRQVVSDGQSVLLSLVSCNMFASTQCFCDDVVLPSIPDTVGLGAVCTQHITGHCDSLLHQSGTSESKFNMLSYRQSRKRKSIKQ